MCIYYRSIRDPYIFKMQDRWYVVCYCLYLIAIWVVGDYYTVTLIHNNKMHHIQKDKKNTKFLNEIERTNKIAIQHFIIHDSAVFQLQSDRFASLVC